MNTAILGKMLEYILSNQTNTSDPWDGRRSKSMGHIRIVSESKSEDAGNFQQDMAGSSELVLIRESASCWSFGLIPWKNHIESQVNATCRASWKWGKDPTFQGRSHHWCQICVALSKVLLLVPWFIENLLELCKLYLWNYGITELITILRTTELWNSWNYELVKRKNFGTLWNYVLFWKVKIKLETIKYCGRLRLAFSGSSK